MFFGKSEEEKEQEKLVQEEDKKKIFGAFKSLIKSDTISVVNNLIQSYVLIFSSYGSENGAKKNLDHELFNLFGSTNMKLETQVNKMNKIFGSDKSNFIKNNATVFYKKNVDNLKSTLNVTSFQSESEKLTFSQAVSESSVAVEFFKLMLNENMDALVDNQSLAQKYILEIDNNDYTGYERVVYTVDFLMTIPLIIGGVFSNILNAKIFFDQENTETTYKDLITILQNVSKENIESKEMIENIRNIDSHLYNYIGDLNNFDIYIYLLCIRDDIIMREPSFLIPDNMLLETNTLINDLKLIKNDIDAVRNIQTLQKEYIEKYIPESFVRIDKYKLQYFDYYTCGLLVEEEILSPAQIISYLVHGFLTKNYEQTYLYKKALWDNERYLKNDFSIEVNKFDLLQRYENIQNGYEFEEFCYSLYGDLGYYVEHTKLSNDQGADLVIEKDGIRTVVQAKHYAFPVGNKAVQEVVASKAFYDNAHHAIVITNSTYTPSAIKLAEANSVELVDGDTIREYIAEINNPETSPLAEH